MARCHASTKAWAFALIAGLFCLGGAAARANETDQFTLPPRDQFADIGDYVNQHALTALQKTVDSVNRDIDRALKLSSEKERAEHMAKLHSPVTLANRLRAQFLPGFFHMMEIESDLDSSAIRDQYPGKITAYKTPMWIYWDSHLPVDPRKLVLLVQSSTVRAYGSFVGVDKFGHFFDLGHYYYIDFMNHRMQGYNEKEAIAKVVKTYSQGPISENGAIGIFATGVSSNADLASNYAGYKFYRNLTEPIQIQGRTLPPLLVRAGDHWRLNDHVSANKPFFKPFISDHWNEALNPNNYEWSMRWGIRRKLEKMAPQLLANYAHPDGTFRTPAEFAKLKTDLSTFWGEEYGASKKDDLITIGNTAYDENGMVRGVDRNNATRENVTLSHRESSDSRGIDVKNSR